MSDQGERIVSDAGATSGNPVPFATNRLVVATAPGNPKKLATIGQNWPDLKIWATREFSSPVSTPPTVESATRAAATGSAGSGRRR